MYAYNNRSKRFASASRKAKSIGYEVTPSSKGNYKLDVYKKGKYVASIGDKKYSDFNIHKDKDRRRNYKARHQKYRKIKGSRSYLADQILW